MYKLLKDSLIFLDPKKTLNIVKKSYEVIIRKLEINDKVELMTQYIFHTSFMIERVLQNDLLTYNNLDELINKFKKEYKIIKKALIVIEESFGINIPDTEVAYIIKIFNTL